MYESVNEPLQGKSRHLLAENMVPNSLQYVEISE